MTYASKTTFCLNNLKILRPKVTKKILRICLRTFVNSQTGHFDSVFVNRYAKTESDFFTLKLVNKDLICDSKIVAVVDNHFMLNMLSIFLIHRTKRIGCLSIIGFCLLVDRVSILRLVFKFWSL